MPAKKDQENGLKFDLEIKLTREIALTEVDEIDGTGNSVTQIFNFIIKEKMETMRFVELGVKARYFDPKSHETINDILGIMHGFSVTTKVAANGEMQVIANPISKIIRNQSALEYMDELKKFKKQNQIIGEHVI